MDKDFTPTQSCTFRNGNLFRSGHTYRLKYERQGKSVTTDFDLSSHPLCTLLPQYLFRGAETLSGHSVNLKFRSMKVLGEYLEKDGDFTLTPRKFTSFVRWLESTRKGGNRRFSANTIIVFAVRTQELYAVGVERKHADWSQSALDIIKVASDRILRKHRYRSVQTSIDKAISGETYNDLLKAISLEFEQCLRVLEARDAGLRSSLYDHSAMGPKRLDPNPYIVLGAASALRHGVRACEFNAHTLGDLRIDPSGGRHELYLHAPNKPDDYIPVDEVFVRAWNLCLQWDEEARRYAGEEVNQGSEASFVYLSNACGYDKKTFRVTTPWINDSLKYFYRKWFNHRVTCEDGEERPLLHSEGDLTRPLSCPFSKMRNAFAVQFAEREKDPALTQAVMRHSNGSTTKRFYLHQTRLDHAQKVHRALKPEAQWLATSLTNAVAAGVSDHTLKRAREAGADLPHGICGPAMNGETCLRASGCLECPHLVVVASRKPRLEADRDAYLRIAEGLNLKGDLRGAENFLSRAKLCQAHITRIEDKFEGGAL